MKKANVILVAVLAVTTLQAPIFAKAADAQLTVAQEQQMEMRKQEILLKLRLAQTQLKQLDEEVSSENIKATVTSTGNAGLRSVEAYNILRGLKDLILGSASKNREEMIRGLNRLILASAITSGHEAYLKEVAVRAETKDETNLKAQREQIKASILQMNQELNVLSNNVR